MTPVLKRVCTKASLHVLGCGWLVVGFVGKGCPASSNPPKEITESRLFTQRLKETAASMLLDTASACLYIFSLPVRPMTSVNFHFILNRARQQARGKPLDERQEANSRASVSAHGPPQEQLVCRGHRPLQLGGHLLRRRHGHQYKEGQIKDPEFRCSESHAQSAAEQYQ